MPPADNLMEKLVSLAKRRGFVFQSSEIYGGLGSVWDYGPLGVELKKNIKERWWRSMVHDREDIEGLDAAILMHPKVRSEEHTSELQSRSDLVCRLLLEKKKPYRAARTRTPASARSTPAPPPRCPWPRPCSPDAGPPRSPGPSARSSPLGSPATTRASSC